MSSLASRLLAGERLALSRVISKLENRDSDSPEILKELFSSTGKAKIWGVTGPPGAGKSTLVDQFIRSLRSQNHTVAVLAVDPSSPFSGGAILGDRIRMQDHISDPKVFIRSLGTRGRQGGLSQATFESVLALDAAGYDHVLVETAGVGQTELEILELAHQVVVVLVPESGDSIQMMKAGLLEIADLFVINKMDRPDADRLQRNLETVLDLLPGRRPQVLKTQANSGSGVDAVVQALSVRQAESAQWMKQKNERAMKRAVFQILTERLRQSVEGAFSTRSGQELLELMTRREIDLYSAADQIAGV
ncbi:MAG: methylmalonyl Co-A mutase-associated GTPase MeaB [Oligoflexia bacterium]